MMKMRFMVWCVLIWVVAMMGAGAGMQEGDDEQKARELMRKGEEFYSFTFYYIF